MPLGNFIKQNFALTMGLALPVLLTFAFMLFANLPQAMGPPPKYDLVFAVPDYNTPGQLPVSVELMVENGSLKAQYVRGRNNGAYTWKKLYLYEAATQKVRELPFGLPDRVEEITTARKDTVPATQGMKLETSAEAPDGYSMSNNNYNNRGDLFGELFWGGGGSGQVRLKKGAASYPLVSAEGRTDFYYGNAEFVGWVTGKTP